MVDLVKVRKKAKEKKNAAAEEQQAAAEVPADQPEHAAPLAEQPPEEATAKEAAAPPSANAGAPAATHGEAEAEGGKLEQFKRRANLRLESMVLEDEGESKDESLLELLLFNIAGEQYALPIERIVEIVPPRRATRVPNADPTIIGIISLRGTIVSILDIRRKLGHPPLQSTGPDSRIIVLENAGETAGFLVDKVSRVVRVDPNRIGSHPVVSISEQSEFIRGVFQHAERLSILLDLETLLRYQDR